MNMPNLASRHHWMRRSCSGGGLAGLCVTAAVGWAGVCSLHATPVNLLSDEDDKAIEWFREGFTLYYGYLLACRGGLMQLPTYIETRQKNSWVSSGSGSLPSE